MLSIISREQALQIDIKLYNKAMMLQWPEHKRICNLSGELRDCKHCKRKYVICCICDSAQTDWSKMITEVTEVSQRDRTHEY